MKKNKFVIILALLLIAGVLFAGKGVNNPITVINDNELFTYEETDMAYSSAKSVLGEGDKNFKVKVDKLPSDDPEDYILASTDVFLKINTARKTLISAEITSESGKYQDRVMMVESFEGEMVESKSLGESNVVIYVGGLSKDEMQNLKEDLGVMLKYKVGGYKEKEMFLSPKEYGYR